MRFYQQLYFPLHTLQQHPSLLSGESSPSYLLNSHIVLTRLKAVAPNAKAIVMLRDPVKRAYSHYCMTVDEKGTKGQLRVRGRSHWKDKSIEQVCV